MLFCRVDEKAEKPQLVYASREWLSADDSGLNSLKNDRVDFLFGLKFAAELVHYAQHGDGQVLYLVGAINLDLIDRVKRLEGNSFLVFE
jgi:hypothetical protein